MHPENSEPRAYPLTEVLLQASKEPARIDGIVVGTLSGFDDNGQPCVAFPSRDAEALPARSTVTLTPGDRWREVAIMFEGGDPRKPIVIGLIHHPVPAPIEVVRDQEKLVLTAEQEIELRCGKSSITLTKAGKIILRGEYLLSRSAGVNRIKGGSVQIN